jgi:hypothetical protein
MISLEKRILSLKGTPHLRCSLRRNFTWGILRVYYIGREKKYLCWYLTESEGTERSGLLENIRGVRRLFYFICFTDQKLELWDLKRTDLVSELVKMSQVYKIDF